jgi:hypothetical protein
LYSILRVFDKEGNPKVEFVINFNVGQFTYIEESSLLYVIDRDVEDNPIKYFDLSKYLD